MNYDEITGGLVVLIFILWLCCALWPAKKKKIK